nr:prenyltransferase/squalene oxidase repeat-containing protein [Alicyclobacillus macrosporangiidus]
MADALCRRIESLQDEDGSWRGRWGICFLYGTWAAVSGLAAAGVPRKDPVMRRAAAWLCRVQHADGGIRGVMPPFLW